ncbi:MAG: dTMP kinase, partial [Lysobacterales bacterium]
MTASSTSRGCLVTFEGGEGAGKSTVLARVRATVEAAGLDVLQTREPGGTAIGEAVRAILLDRAHIALVDHAELLLMFAARAQLVREVIEPALARGAWVLSDRFTDSSFAYQGAGRGIDLDFIAELERRVVGIQPDLTLLLDLPVSAGHAR